MSKSEETVGQAGQAGQAGEDVRPSAFIQWKGTDACIDLRCECGEIGHFDGFFAYFLKCGSCGRVYRLPGVVPVQPLAQGEVPGLAPRLAVVDDGDAPFQEVRVGQN